MNTNILISIVMASNKIDEFLYLAVNSILEQTYQNIELIFIANGEKSSDISSFLLNRVKDKRLKVIETPISQLSFSLNLGISYAKGQYIARMDADDISLRDRLVKQINYIIKHNLDMVGTDIKLINSKGEDIGIRRYPKNINRINKELLYRNTFSHNTILIKKNILLAVRGYNSGFNSEDYDLWLRLRRYGVKWDNMEECLLEYRIHDASTQRRRLGYAEAAGYSLREFLLNPSFLGLVAIFFHIMKVYIRSKKE
ncbi:glycosyltransferase [Salmonella enterica]|uniref:Hyaluronan synthase n=2 Tax=Salmonella enterica subsp. arizonae TaxID=59203 RepID=A0A379TC33_SALER|nr:glycosyltransferase [Salmonella enterica]EHR2371908.1 glycosyltransferase [Salmonella enterica]EHS9493127.1 glycosyltransferase [Salmonella enterica]EHS9800357.1 glycosyltransferase [Salmonella enterica]EHU6812200.1 glycosyltransferase [Salmonella enterica]EHW6112041.1 glycosyltransferase [Salmonella enterica]